MARAKIPTTLVQEYIDRINQKGLSDDDKDALESDIVSLLDEHPKPPVFCVVWLYVAYYKKHRGGGNAPTPKQIGASLKFSAQAADGHLDRLHRKRWLQFDANNRPMLAGGEYVVNLPKVY
jgi:hypothetical protein